MARSLWSKVKRALLVGPAPAHLHGHLKVPFHVRLWRAIGPPSKAPHERRPLNRNQKLLLRGSASAIVLIGGGWFVYNYFATAEARSADALQEGMKLLGPGDYKAAASQFTDAIGIWPGNAQAYLERGNAYDAMGQSAEALADWTRAIEADPGLAAAYAARGTHYRVKGDYEKALADLNRSLELDPSVEAYYQRGQVRHALGRYQEAVADFDLSIAELRGAPYVYRARSAARRAMGDLEGAAADRDKADDLEQIH